IVATSIAAAVAGFVFFAERSSQKPQTASPSTTRSAQPMEPPRAPSRLSQATTADAMNEQPSPSRRSDASMVAQPHSSDMPAASNGPSGPKKPVKGKPKPWPSRTSSDASHGRDENGFLTVRVTPWALVSIDGKPIKQTPLTNYPVAAGKHIIELLN